MNNKKIDRFEGLSDETKIIKLTEENEAMAKLLEQFKQQAVKADFEVSTLRKILDIECEEIPF